MKLMVIVFVIIIINQLMVNVLLIVKKLPEVLEMHPVDNNVYVSQDITSLKFNKEILHANLIALKSRILNS